jgi:HemY protein
MKTGFTIIVALLIGALGAHLALPDNGYALINFRGYIIETSVPVLLLLLILAYLAVRTLVYLWQAPRRLSEAWARGRAKQAGRKATQGYIALAEGRLAQGERLLTRGARHSETPLLNYLAAARAAQMQGDRQRRDAWLNMACEQEPAATDAVLLTQAELQLEDGQFAEALASLNRVRERQPGHAQALKLLGDLHRRRNEWQPLAELLPLIRRHGNVAPAILDEWGVAAWSNIMATLQADRGALERLWDDVPRHLRREPRLTLARARALVACSAVDDAELEIRRTLNDKWSEALVELYGQLAVPDTAAHLKRIEAWLKEHPEDPVLLLAAGRTCVRHQLWGKARSYFEASLALRAAPETWRALGQLMAQIGETQAAARAFERGLSMAATTPQPIAPTPPALPAVPGNLAI